jgi:hypothetical protein
MTRVAILCGTMSCCVLAACGPSGGDDVSGVDANLNCSALISAANSLVVSGKVDNDPELAKRALVTSMTYLNAYAIPKGLKEGDAFTEVKARRATLIETLSPDEVMSRAKRCMDRSPL